MPNLKIKPIDSFKQYVAYVEDRRAKGPTLLWYRGCGKTTHKLTPSLYRHGGTPSIEDLIALENDLIARFKQRSIPFHDRTITAEWEWLFFMQHFGVPTRLLDWTESPLMALFFAVTSAQYKLGEKGKPVFANDAAVWVLDPIKWNKRSVDLESFEGKVLTSDEPNASAYTPVGDCNSMKDYPIAIYGAHNSQRIVAQRGVFVCFGKKTSPMEDVYTSGTFPVDCLVKLTIKRCRRPMIMSSAVPIRNVLL